MAMRAAVAAALLAPLLGGAAFLWGAGWSPDWRAVETWLDRAAPTFVADRLTVRDVLIEGRVHTPRADIVEAIGVTLGEKMTRIDPEAIRRRLEAVSWVPRAQVQRRFPATLHLRISERAPMALWQRGDRLTLVGRDGAPIADRHLDRFAGLMLIAGADAPRAAPRLFALLATLPELDARVRAAVRVGGRRWNVHFDNGAELRLPEKAPDAAWSRLAELERRHGLLARNPAVIDLRLPDRLILRPRREGGPAGAGGKRT